MNWIFYLLSLICAFASCASDQNKTVDGSAVAHSSDDIAGKKDLLGCYRMIIKKDTVQLDITKADKTIEGDLHYHWYEKDHNDGSFVGEVISDSLLLANYTFKSEGRQSVRQVVFKIKDGMLLQGYGEEHSRRDTSFLREPKLAVFDTKHPFRKGCN